MTSHKEQPAVDTSAEKILDLADELRSVVDEGDDLGENATNPTTIYLRRVLERVEAVLRSLAAHPAEPAGMELETTAEERRHHADMFLDPDDQSMFLTRFHRDFERMRARAEKAEAALKQPVSDDEVGTLRKLALAATPGPWEVDEVKSDGGHTSYEVQAVSDQWWVNGKSIVDTYNSGLIEIRQESEHAWDEVGRRNTEYIAAANPEAVLRIIAQLRDAQARGKGMEEALEDLRDYRRMIPDIDAVCTHNPINQVYFRAGLIACREYMARFVSATHPEIAESIRANWWPSLGADPGAPRQLTWDEVADEKPSGRIDHRDMSPSIEALPRAWAFLTGEDRAALSRPEGSAT